MTELSGYVFATLRGGEFTLYRGSGDGLEPILLVAPIGEYATRESLKRLEHEHDLKAELDADWAARPLALSRYDGRMALVLEDPGGEPLDQLLGQPMDVTQFLRLAIPLAAAIGQVHLRGLIHKDIKPANILVGQLYASLFPAAPCRGRVRLWLGACRSLFRGAARGRSAAQASQHRGFTSGVARTALQHSEKGLRTRVVTGDPSPIAQRGDVIFRRLGLLSAAIASETGMRASASAQR